MVDRLTLHYAPDNASLCVRLALLAARQGFDTVLVDRRAGGQWTPAYLAINPNGLIPTLVTPDGPLFETGAILLWLGDRYPDAAMVPPPGQHDRGQVLTWLFWLSNTLHPAMRIVFYPDQYIGTAEQPALIARTEQRLQAMLDILNTAVPGLRGWIGGDRVSVLDCYLGPLLRWMALYPQGGTGWFDLTRWPELLAVAQRMDSRPITQDAINAEGLGTTPFSHPDYPVPPYGSVF